MSRLPDHDPEAVATETETIALVVDARPRDLGGFSVRRALPSPKRRLVGPFIFFDHMGPAVFEPGHGMDVRPHPHIALATVTYLFEGEIIHKDTLGSDQAIRPGDVNWMTAGRGIAHSERTSAETRKRGGGIHGIQCWVALPKADEETDPSFTHYPSATIPSVTREGAKLRVIAGSAYGETSPVSVKMPTLYVEAILEKGAELPLPNEHPERAVYVVSGTIACDGHDFVEGTMMIYRPGTSAIVKAREASRIMILGGAPIDGERHIWWNFVSSSETRIEQAKRDWKEGRFPKVPGDEVELIPLPEH